MCVYMFFFQCVFYVCLYVCAYVYMCLSIYVCYVCMYVWVCMCVSICVLCVCLCVCLKRRNTLYPTCSATKFLYVISSKQNTICLSKLSKTNYYIFLLKIILSWRFIYIGMLWLCSINEILWEMYFFGLYLKLFKTFF